MIDKYLLKWYLFYKFLLQILEILNSFAIVNNKKRFKSKIYNIKKIDCLFMSDFDFVTFLLLCYCPFSSTKR